MFDLDPSPSEWTVLIKPRKTPLIMIFNPQLTREAISGLEVTPEQLQEFDKQNFLEEEPCPASSPQTPVRKKRSRFAIGTPEKILEEARRKEEEGGRKVGGRRKSLPPGRRAGGRQRK